MQNVVRLIRRVARDEEGTALVEYSILLGVIAVAVVGAAIAVGGWSQNQWHNLCTALGLSC
jgi:pilus assembly protein Flp/PilA